MTEPIPQEPGLPGGPIRLRPLEINGKFYDPLRRPPRQITGPNGEVSYIGGRELDKDDVYAQRFWDRQSPSREFRDDLTRAMTTNIHTAGEIGSLSMFVTEGKLAETDKEHMSAYRQLARKLGYQVGEFKHAKGSPTAIAEISKVTPAVQE